MITFAFIIIAIILSLKTTAKPDYNGDDSGCSGGGCHIFEDNDKSDYIHIDCHQDEEGLIINVIFFNGNQPESSKIIYRWNETIMDWDKDSEIIVGLQLTDNKAEGVGSIHNISEGYAPNVEIKAPDGGKWRIYAGYQNGTEEGDNFTRYYTCVEIFRHLTFFDFPSFPRTIYVYLLLDVLKGSYEISMNIVDQSGNIIIGGKNSSTLADGEGAKNFKEIISLELKGIKKSDSGILLKYKVKLIRLKL